MPTLPGILANGKIAPSIDGEGVLSKLDNDLVVNDAKDARALIDLQLESISAPVLAEVSATSGGQWGPRDGAKAMFLGDDCYLIGGWAGGLYDSDWDDNPSATCNQVYKTSDFGVTWSRIRNHDPTPDSTHFTPRHWFCCHVAEDRMWIVNGDTGAVNNGAVNSDCRWSTDGITWTKVNSVNPGYHGTFLNFSGYMDGIHYVAGGHSDITTAASALNAVWKSTDGCVTWTNMGNAPWAARGMVDQLPYHDGKLWLIGGARHATLDVNRVVYNDVWSFDGTTWTEVLADGHSQWEGSLWSNAFALDGWLYTSRGYSPSLAANTSGTYRSRDGVTWEAVDWDLPASHADSLAVHSTGVLIAAGNWTLSGTPVNATSPTSFATAFTDPIQSVQEYVQSNVEAIEYVFNPSGTATEIRVGGSGGTLTSSFKVGGFVMEGATGQCLAGKDGSGYYFASGFVTDSLPIFIGSGENQIRMTSTVYFRGNGAGGWVLSTALTDRLTVNSSGTMYHVAAADLVSSFYAARSTVYSKLSNTQTTGVTLLAWAENATDASTPFYIQRYGSTHATKPNQVDVWNYNNGPISVGINNSEVALIESTQLTLRQDFVFVPYSSKSLSVNGQMAIEATSNTAGNIVYRGSDGVTRRAALTFS